MNRTLDDLQREFEQSFDPPTNNAEHLVILNEYQQSAKIFDECKAQGTNLVLLLGLSQQTQFMYGIERRKYMQILKEAKLIDDDALTELQTQLTTIINVRNKDFLDIARVSTVDIENKIQMLRSRIDHETRIMFRLSDRFDAINKNRRKHYFRRWKEMERRLSTIRERYLERYRADKAEIFAHLDQFAEHIGIRNKFATNKDLAFHNWVKYGCSSLAAPGIGPIMMPTMLKLDYNNPIYRVSVVPGEKIVYNQKDLDQCEMCELYGVNVEYSKREGKEYCHRCAVEKGIVRQCRVCAWICSDFGKQSVYYSPHITNPRSRCVKCVYLLSE